ncbi:hypothetical protein PpBr36_08563 [Pyricularia pennisetigena]|uniref:hypothetical protein n=1 Tax=Pyricularia pennisetigena TaxID=1578925 RepID=UPI00114D9874|nr:hypothetical protein PpBr36_08563 [Pyricularia pennisetigena]TLS24003.1 hypothetical protein PpBr36_08563 [Pyricularia pennisetigena]
MCRSGCQVHGTVTSCRKQQIIVVASRCKTSESFRYPDVPPRHEVYNAAEIRLRFSATNL